MELLIKKPAVLANFALWTRFISSGHENDRQVEQSKIMPFVEN